MTQDIIVYIILAVTTIYVLSQAIKKLLMKPKDSCSGCNGCSLKKEFAQNTNIDGKQL